MEKLRTRGFEVEQERIYMNEKVQNLENQLLKQTDARADNDSKWSRLYRQTMITALCIFLLVSMPGYYLLFRSNQAAEERADQTAEIEQQNKNINDLQERMICFGSRTEIFNSAISDIFTIALSRGVENATEEERLRYEEAVHQLEKYKEEVRIGELGCLDDD